VLHKTGDRSSGEGNGAPGRKYSGSDLIRDIAVSLLYTTLIVVLIKLKIIQPISNYMPAK